MKHPFLTITGVIITVIIAGAILITVFNPNQLSAYSKIVKDVGILWFLVGVGYVIVCH